MSDEQNPEETEDDFDLFEHLQGLDRRTAEVTIFYDEKRGAEYQQISSALNILQVQVDVAESDEARQAALEKFEEQSAKVEELRQYLLKQTATFHLRAVPPLIMKDVFRKARKALGITEKGNAGREDEINQRVPLELTAAQTVSLIDNRTGRAKKSVDADYLERLSGLLPPMEWFKVLDAVNDLQNRNVFAGMKVDNADFSQGI